MTRPRPGAHGEAVRFAVCMLFFAGRASAPRRKVPAGAGTGPLRMASKSFTESVIVAEMSAQWTRAGWHRRQTPRRLSGARACCGTRWCRRHRPLSRVHRHDRQRNPGGRTAPVERQGGRARQGRTPRATTGGCARPWRRAGSASRGRSGSTTAMPSAMTEDQRDDG